MSLKSKINYIIGHLSGTEGGLITRESFLQHFCLYSAQGQCIKGRAAFFKLLCQKLCKNDQGSLATAVGR